MLEFKIIITLVLIGQFAFAQDKIQKIDSLLNAMYTQKSINGNFLIAENGNVIYKKSFGLANEVTKEKLNENSIFELASVSKQFTAMAIMILKEKGKLNLDDDFTKHIPELSNYKGITIKDLLYHTSGLAEYENLMIACLTKIKSQRIRIL
jgi:CubicO group peptidase (beta-lactamase class C family)